MNKLRPEKLPEKAPERVPEGAAPAERTFPFALGRLREEFDQVFNRLHKAWRDWEGGHDWRWDLKVEDGGEAVVVRAEAPGFAAEDLDVQVTEDRLVLRASRKEEVKEEQGGRQEEGRREFYEAVTLPAGIDKDKVEAVYQSGVLTVTLPKTEVVRPRRIPVRGS
jgi:HSP20 family protein